MHNDKQEPYYLNILIKWGSKGNKAWVTNDMAQAESLGFDRSKVHGKRESLTQMLLLTRLTIQKRMANSPNKAHDHKKVLN
jgi:hypothetical protein